MQRLSATGTSLARPASWPWPLPAVVIWAAAWFLFHGLVLVGFNPILAVAMAMMPGMFGRRWAGTPARRAMVFMGFPLSFMGMGLSVADQAWIWLALALLLMLAYPRKARQDAPFYPTEQHALTGLAELAPLPSWPSRPKPQQYAAPPCRMAQVWTPPAAMADQSQGPKK